jgi:hypothetical protein
VQQLRPVRRRPAHHAVDAGRLSSIVLLGHLSDRQQLRGSRAGEKGLKALHPRAVARPRGPEDPVLEPPYGRLRRGPVNVGPRHRLPVIVQFGSHRPTSPMMQVSSSIAPSRPAGSLRPFGLGIPALAALSAPLQGGVRFLRLSSTPSAVPLPRGRDTAVWRGGWGLPCCLMGSSAGAAASSRPAGVGVTVAGYAPPANRPAHHFGSGHQPLGPVLDNGLYRTLDFVQPTGHRWRLVRVGAPRLGSLSPALGTSDCSFALPGSGTQVNGVFSR